MTDFFEIKTGTGPFVGAAIHEGNRIREELLDLISLAEDERLREEDPFTGYWADIAATTIKGKFSRFETDLNRPRDKAIYKTPDDAWGLNVWHKPLTNELINRSLANYDRFYSEIKELFDKKINAYGGILVYDFHSYNHKRDGNDKPPADPQLNPEINLGTANMNRKKWNDAVEEFIKVLQSFDYMGRTLDVRENIKFKGGYFSQWIYETYGDKCCVIAIEVKKFFMDEWTGTPDRKQIELLKTAFAQTVQPVMQKFNSIIHE